MSLNKAIEHGKEHRKLYSGAKSMIKVVLIMELAYGANQIEDIKNLKK